MRRGGPPPPRRALAARRSARRVAKEEEIAAGAGLGRMGPERRQEVLSCHARESGLYQSHVDYTAVGEIHEDCIARSWRQVFVAVNEQVAKLRPEFRASRAE